MVHPSGFIDQIGESAEAAGQLDRVPVPRLNGFIVVEEGPEGRESDEVLALEGNKARTGLAAHPVGIVSMRAAVLLEGDGYRVLPIGWAEDRVDDEPLVADAEVLEFAAVRSASRRAGASGRATSTTVVVGVRRAPHRGREPLAVHRSPARVQGTRLHARWCRGTSSMPWELEEPERVARGSSIEDQRSNVSQSRREEPGKLIERGDLGRAGPESCSRIVRISSSLFRPS